MGGVSGWGGREILSKKIKIKIVNNYLIHAFGRETRNLPSWRKSPVFNGFEVVYQQQDNKSKSVVWFMFCQSRHCNFYWK